MKKRIISAFIAFTMLGTEALMSGCAEKKEREKDEATSVVAEQTAQVEEEKKLDEAGLLNAFKSEAGIDYIYFLPADYDDDGTLEAFGITGTSSFEEGLYDGVTIWFITSEGECSIAESNTYGLLKETITVPNGSFITWCVTAGGSGSSDLIFGCKDGELFEPQVSGQYAGFGDRNMSYMFSDTNDFDKLNCDYIGYYSYFEDGGGHVWDPIAFDYDETTREFVQSDSQAKTSANDDYDYSKILAGDFSDFAGRWSSSDGASFYLQSNGTQGSEINSIYNAEMMQQEDDGSYRWYVSVNIDGRAYEGYWMILYPIGVNVVAYNGSIVNTDTSQVRIWCGNGDVTNDAEDIYNKE